MTGTKKKSSQSSVLWWIVWILLTIGTFFASSSFWTWFIANRVGPMSQSGVPILWVSAVFGTWMVLLVPLIIIMYNKVDKAYEEARIRRETQALKEAERSIPFKSIYMDESKRLLPKELIKKIRRFPQPVKGGHLVTAVLRDGRRIENVFVLNKTDVLGVYGYEALPFQIEEIADLEPADLDHLPDYKVENWLRLDGVGIKESV